MPGPPPTPTAILQLRGSWRAQQRKDEPPADGKVPDPPMKLRGEALAMWSRLWEHLVHLGVASSSDEMVALRLCRCWAVYVEMSLYIDRHGANTKKGLPRPQLAVLESCNRQLDKMGQQLGLTPAARATLAKRAAVEPPKAKDGKDPARFFKKPAVG